MLRARGHVAALWERCEAPPGFSRTATDKVRHGGRFPAGVALSSLFVKAGNLRAFIVILDSPRGRAPKDAGVGMRSLVSLRAGKIHMQAFAEATVTYGKVNFHFTNWGDVMAQVVCVHGIGQQREAPNTLHAVWAPALCGGVKLAGGTLAEDAVKCAFYGDLFRPPGRPLSAGDTLVQADDLDPFEQDLLVNWWEQAARTDAAVISPDARTLARTPRSVQGALWALSGSRFFAALGERALLGDLRQVRDYFHNPDIRREARQRVSEAVTGDTRVLVGHSLGSVVAYEALRANPGWPVRMLVTLGSPLGIPNLIFERLDPAPLSAAEAEPGPRGRWPGKGREWVNVADQGDVVALVKDLRVAFGPGVDCWVVDNGATAHDVRPYLTAEETGRAVRNGLESRRT